jgi:lipoprotein-anchoring transpeptidase ErfK/SrfK
MINRRLILGVLAGAPLAACNTIQNPPQPFEVANPGDDGWYVGLMEDEPHDIPLVDRTRMKPEFMRQAVDYPGTEKPGTIVVDIDQRFLYLVEEKNKATRYGIGVGRDGFSWRGVATIQRKAVWPSWRPTPTMMRILRDLPNHADPGLDNPLGARALYLYQNGQDTLFRIHGTNEPWSIGEAVSSGCVRMLNEDVYDLYNRVPLGTTVLVRRHGRWRV